MLVVALGACGPQSGPELDATAPVDPPPPTPLSVASPAEAAPVVLADHTPEPPVEVNPASNVAATQEAAPPEEAEPAPAPAPEPAERTMQCESGVVDGPDGTQTSSAVAERVPADTALDPGCHWID